MPVIQALRGISRIILSLRPACFLQQDLISKHNTNHIPLLSQVSWCMPVITVCGRMKQEDHKFELSLGYIVSSRQP